MKLFYFLLLLACNQAIGQITVDGTSTQATLANNAPAVVVDPALTVTTAISIPQFIVKITNYNTGDVLANGTLPSGFTAAFSTGTGQLTITGAGTDAQYQQILRTVTFRTTSSVTTARTIVFQAGDGTVQLYGGHYYKLVSGSYAFSAGKTAAAALSLFGWQGYLATITTAGENTFVFSVGKGWIGASDDNTEINTALGTTTYATQAASEGKWFWINGPEKGTQFSNGSVVISGKYASWNSGEPNNGTNENFAENSYPNNGSWNDAAPTNLNNILVEFGTTGVTVDIIHSRTITMIATQLNIAAPVVPYELHATAVSVDAGITGYSVSNFSAGRVTISSGFKSGDALSFGTLPAMFSGSYNSTTGVLTFSSTLPATIADWQSLFRTVKFNSTSNIVGDRTITFSLGNLVAFSNGHFYEYISTGATWDNAKTNAEGRSYSGLQGYLVTIMSATENDFIRQTLSADAWTGASDNFSYINAATGATTYASQTASEGKWYWVTGPEKGTQMTTGNAPSSTTLPPVAGSTYNNWNNGEPNNSSTNENGGTIYSTGANAGKWNDLNTATSVGYVVEYGGLSTDPLLQLSASRVVAINMILPVRDLQFSVSPAGADVKLDWSTQAESNSRNYEILHSVNGSSYTAIGSVLAAGNSSVATKYSYVHTAPGAGTHYYKLAQYDINGTVHYSEVRTVKLGEGVFKLYPTVATSTVQVVVPGRAASFNVSVTNSAGVRVIVQQLSGQTATLDLSKLAPGVYFAEVIKGEERQVFRIIKK